MTEISRAEHEEFVKRIEEQEKRQDRRLELLETDVDNLQKLSTNIEKLAVNMDSMCKELSRQGTRLENLEARDGEKWRQTVACVISAIAGALVSYFFTLI